MAKATNYNKSCRHCIWYVQYKGDNTAIEMLCKCPQWKKARGVRGLVEFGHTRVSSCEYYIIPELDEILGLDL